MQTKLITFQIEFVYEDESIFLLLLIKRVSIDLSIFFDFLPQLCF